MKSFQIGAEILSDHRPPLIVGEVGINHNGSLMRAMEMIQCAAECGVDAVKFGAFKAAEFCQPDDPLYPVFKSSELPDDAWMRLRAECDRQKVIFFATPQNPSDLWTLLEAGIPCIKVGSDDLTNIALIERYASHGLPLILSTGMADLDEVQRAYQAAGRNALVLACTSEYPCPPRHVNVRRVECLRSLYGLAGFSDHTQGNVASIAAVAFGACYLEKHFTMSHELEGPDHAWSANPGELRSWVQAIREASESLGTGRIAPSPAEIANRAKWRRTSGQQLRGV